MSAQCAVGVAEMKRSPVVRGARGSERPENCPVDSFQWRTGGSPGHEEFRPRCARESLPKQALRPLQGSNASIEDADMRFFNSAASGSVQNDIKHATSYSERPAYSH